MVETVMLAIAYVLLGLTIVSLFAKRLYNAICFFTAMFILVELGSHGFFK